jgi:hypothetical protein
MFKIKTLLFHFFLTVQHLSAPVYTLYFHITRFDKAENIFNDTMRITSTTRENIKSDIVFFGPRMDTQVRFTQEIKDGDRTGGSFKDMMSCTQNMKVMIRDGCLDHTVKLNKIAFKKKIRNIKQVNNDMFSDRHVIL